VFWPAWGASEKRSNRWDQGGRKKEKRGRLTRLFMKVGRARVKKNEKILKKSGQTCHFLTPAGVEVKKKKTGWSARGEWAERF